MAQRVAMVAPNPAMFSVDGATLEGGGQVIRMTSAISALLGGPLHPPWAGLISAVLRLRFGAPSTQASRSKSTAFAPADPNQVWPHSTRLA
jgi:hypothetical protein